LISFEEQWVAALHPSSGELPALGQELS